MAPVAPMWTPRPVQRKKRVEMPDLVAKFPPRGSGPVHISELLNPILEICHHPDRDRLLTNLFREM